MKIEQSIIVKDVILNSPLISSQGKKLPVIEQIIRILEFFLEITGKKMENFQIRVLAGDLYERFRNDSLDDIIMMFKMIRTGELGKVGYTEHFNEKIMLYVDLYMHHKSEEREKLINLQKRKIRDRERQTPMSAEAFERFTELQGKLQTIKEKPSGAFAISKALKSMDGYLEDLDKTSQNLSDNDLKFEIIKAQSTNKQAWEILMLEQERRKTQKELKK